MDRRRFLSGLCPSCMAAVAQPLGALAAARPAPDGTPQALELGVPSMTRLAKTVWIARIAPHVWLHTTTWRISPMFYYPANGLILDRPDGALMIDTTWSPGQAEVLLDWSRRRLSSPITAAVATHFHNDRVGGIPALTKHGIQTVASSLTCSLAKTAGLPVPAPLPGLQTAPQRFGEGCELYYPGAGHTRGNIVAWLGSPKVLFGGALIRSETSINLGNVKDAVVADWPQSVRNVQARYPKAKIVVPGDGSIAGDPIGHPLDLLAKTVA